MQRHRTWPLFILLILTPAAAASPRLLGDGMIPIAETTNCADREMKIGQYYLSKREQVAAVGRFKSVITQCPRSLEAEEAMAHLTELGLELGVPAIAQNAVAVLESKFPSGRWTIEAHDRLRSAGLEPTEDERSWVVKAFR